MGATLRVTTIALGLALATACGQRQVEVRTAPSTSATAEQSVQVTNSLTQAVNVYVTPSGSAELFLRQVPANSVERLPVQGVASGTSVVFKAVTVDGTRTYQSRNVSLTSQFLWTVP